MTLLCNENLNNFIFITRMQKLFKGENYSKEETIHGNTVVVKKPNYVVEIKEFLIFKSHSFLIVVIFSKA